MTTATDQFVDIAKKGQEAVTTAVQTWAENAQAFATNLTAGQPQLPDTKAIVNSVFDFADHLLATQREFAQSLVAAGVKANETATNAVQDKVTNSRPVNNRASKN